ncbi:MAG: isoamylase early set domain-containing protein [Sedimentisphaerales bacterium]|nr:isoamylase early set domain-containing protein [Sedimentisphaerales bacterium]
MATKQAIAKKQVTFTCKVNSEAQAVYLVGDFNDWQPTVGKMNEVKNGTFKKKMKLTPGNYQYKFIVDGVWFNDPNAEEQTMNPYGTLNSIVRVK